RFAKTFVTPRSCKLAIRRESPVSVCLNRQKNATYPVEQLAPVKMLELLYQPGTKTKNRQPEDFCHQASSPRLRINQKDIGAAGECQGVEQPSHLGKPWPPVNREPS